VIGGSLRSREGDEGKIERARIGGLKGATEIPRSSTSYVWLTGRFKTRESAIPQGGKEAIRNNVASSGPSSLPRVANKKSEEGKGGK